MFYNLNYLIRDVIFTLYCYGFVHNKFIYVTYSKISYLILITPVPADAIFKNAPFAKSKTLE